MRMIKLLGIGFSYEDTLLWKKDMTLPETPAPVSPTAPVEEVGIELDDAETERSEKTGKDSLKVSTSTSDSTGLKA